ncbi:hypothetical protein HYDPIDRAFT_166803 [Hydnomerulius pinastri MD-312]|nr:hypothetical protein HYDPIDRAFT_166803 [Hydnomerulius pinastri MD-312]
MAQIFVPRPKNFGPATFLDIPQNFPDLTCMVLGNVQIYGNTQQFWALFVIGDLMVVGGRKVVQQIRATVHDCDLIYAIKDYLIDGWWNPLDHEMGLWYEAARLARAQLFWLDFQHLATRYGVETYSRDT